MPLELNPGHWYALRVRARFEKQASELLKLKGYQTFLPVSISRRRWTDRIRHVESALFPGYVFCRMGELTPGLASTAPGVMHFVGFGRTPAPVNGVEIAAIARIVEAGPASNPWPYLKVGETVEISSGPLSGVTGFLLAINGNRSSWSASRSCSVPSRSSCRLRGSCVPATAESPDQPAETW